MIEIGRLCVKTAGREAGKKCVVVDTVNDRYVLVDGWVKRRKCNINHLEMLEEVLKIKKNAAHEDIVKEFKKIGIDIKGKRAKPKKERPKKLRKIERAALEKEREEKKIKKVKKKKGG